MADASTTPVWVRRITTLFVAGVCFTSFLFFFNALTTVLLGVLAAAIVACALDPFRRFVPGPRGLAAGIVGLTLIAAVGALLLAFSLPLAKPFQRQFENWPQSKASIDELLLHWSERSHLEKPMSSNELLKNLSGFFAADRASLLLADVRDALLAILLWLAFVFVGSIFLLASPRDVLLSPMLRAVPPAHRRNIRDMLDTLGSRLRWWMIGAIGGMCVVFTASAIGYSIARLKFALPLALLAGIAELVPTIGPAVAAIIATLFAASQSSGAVVGVVITYTIIQSLEAYLILPLIMRGAVQIHPAITLFSVVLWAKNLGLPGLMLAIPINLTIGSAVEYLYVRPREQAEGKSAAQKPELAETQ